MHATFTRFAEPLNRKFSRHVTATEDSIRYTLFAALLEAGLQPDEVILEYPHPVIPRAQVDTWIPSFQNTCYAMEFKYDRDPPGGKNQPKTQKAAAVFRDIHRQLLVSQSGDVSNNRSPATWRWRTMQRAASTLEVVSLAL